MGNCVHIQGHFKKYAYLAAKYLHDEDPYFTSETGSECNGIIQTKTIDTNK
jgi:hypothetical protein